MKLNRNRFSSTSNKRRYKDTMRKRDERKQARIVKTVHPTQETLRRRLDLESDIMQWFPYYFPNVFYRPFGEVHHRLGRKLQLCIETGGRYCFTMPRGGGKSSFGKPASVYCAITGKSKFPVAIGASAKLTEAYHDFVLISLMNNPKLREDYPEVCKFFESTEGKAIKAHNMLLEDGTNTGLKLKPDHIAFPFVSDTNGNPYPSAGATIFFRSMDSKIRGIAETMQDGSIIRPTMVFPDDIQDDDIAASDILSAKYERKIISSVMGLAGPDVKLACFMPGTVQRKGDVISRFLDRKLHPDFQGENVPMVIKWPDSKETLWKTYEEYWRDDLENERGLDRCVKYLKENWDAMHKGAELSWNERIREGELSALQTAFHLWFENGDSFFSEYQGEPKDEANSQYRLTVDMILDHSVSLPKLHIPENHDIITAHTDINRSGLHWCIGAFSQNMTCHVPLYGKTPVRGELWSENANQQEKERGIFRGLKLLCDNLEELNLIQGDKTEKIQLLLIDRGYEHTIVDQFCQQAKYSFRVIPNFGQPSDKYRPSKSKAIGRIMDGCYYGKFPTGRAVAHNSDKCRELAQRSFLTDVGSSGGTTIFHTDSQKGHIKFAEHLTGERLTDKYDDKHGLHYVWKKHNNKVNVDWLDAFVGCWVGALYLGLSPSGMVIKKEKKKANVIIYRPKARAL